MSGMMQATLIGRLGQNPEVKTAGSTSVCKISVAVSEKWKDQQGNQQERTSWFRAEMWGTRGEAFAKYHAKGDMCALSGTGVIEKFTDKNGVDRESFKLKAMNFTFLPNGKKAESGGGGGGGGTGGNNGDIEEDIPF